MFECFLTFNCIKVPKDKHISKIKKHFKKNDPEMLRLLETQLRGSRYEKLCRGDDHVSVNQRFNFKIFLN